MSDNQLRRLSSGLKAWTLALSIAAGLCLTMTPVWTKEKIVFQSMMPQLDPLPPRKVLHGNVTESSLIAPPQTNIFGYAEQGSRYPTTVTYVAPNSVAWLGGLQAGDHVFNGLLKRSKIYMVVQRGQKKYGCVLDSNSLSGPSIQATNAATQKLSAQIDHSDSKRLSEYAIAMVVDNSASMATKDCPGGVSRWQWCKDHIGKLYEEERGVLRDHISIVTFDSNFHSRQNCSPGDLQSVFATGDPTGETNMAPALDEAFLLVRRQLDTGRPAIVSVISDGRPSDVENLKKSIIRETNSLSTPNLLSIVFIEVGTPEHYLKELDNDLVKQGAKADIVKVIPFADAGSQGLSKTLASTLPKPVETTVAKAPTSAAAGTEGKATEAIKSHIYTYTPPTPTHAAVAPVPRPAPIKPVIVKAHPAGTSANGAAAAAPVEVDEKDAVLRGNANRTYR